MKKDINELFDNEKNGTNLQNKIAKLLKQDGWDIKEEQPYLDPITDKQRYLDIIAFKKYSIGNNDFWIKNPEVFEMRLFIDCKNIPQGLALYSRDVEKEDVLGAFLQKGVYNRLYKNYFNMNGDIPTISKSHRYFSNKKIIHKSSNNDEKSIGIQGINQVLNAMHSKIYQSHNSWNIDYPVIVINPLTNVGIEYEEDQSREFANKNMIYGIDYILNRNKEHFLIDIVGSGMFSEFLQEINIEFEGLKQPIFQQLLHNSLNNS